MTLSPAARKSAIAALQRGFDDLDHAAPFALRVVPAKTEIGHQFAELLQALQIFGLIFLGEFHDQDRVGIAAHRRADHRLEHRDVAAERDHGAVDQFDRDRPQLHQMLGGIHGLVEAAEMADAQHLVADHRPELQLDLCRESQRPLRADQEMRHIVRRIARHQRIEIVAADPALHFWKSCRRSPQPRVRRGRACRETGRDRCPANSPARDRAAPRRNASSVPSASAASIDKRVVAHGAVAQRPSAAGIVAGHAADGGARGGGDIDRKPEAVLPELTVEIVEHDARLDHASAGSRRRARGCGSGVWRSRRRCPR